MCNFIGPPRPFLFTREAWSEAAECGLQGTFRGGEQELIESVHAGKAQLYRVNGDSWLICEPMFDGKMLFLWCYQGRQLVRLIDTLLGICAKAGVVQISFFTHHFAVIRALRRYAVWSVPTKVRGEAQYVIEVQAALACISENLHLRRAA